ncbi:MAG: hypothetical protein AAF250_02380 [Pseudomonadota bacterium]
MMWVLFALSLVELAVVHFFVALKWPWIGWPLTIISAIAAIWLVVWIRSFQKLPHRLDDEGLLLRLGNLKSVRVGVADIARIARGWESGATNAKDAINLAGIAYPNRCVELVEPIEKGRRRVFIRLDHPDEFDTALTEAGVTVA